jgi:cytidylate kinase
MYSDDKDLGSRRVIITIAGQIGSGKSAVCRQLNKHTYWEIIATGAIMRRAAMRSGMSILQMNEYAMSHAELDAEVYDYLVNLREGSESIIVDSRLAWHFLPSSLKVYLVVEPQIGAQRIFEATRVDEKYPSVQAAYSDSLERQRLETERYMKLYAVDCQSWYNYHLVIDTTFSSPEQIAALILKRLRHVQSVKPHPTKCYISPKRLIPTKELPQIVSASAVPTEDEVEHQEFDTTRLVNIGVFKGSYLIINGHRSVSAAIRNNEHLISCNLVAFELEEISPSLSLESFATTSISLPLIQRWEEAHRFHFISYPSWLAKDLIKTKKPR